VRRSLCFASRHAPLHTAANGTALATSVPDAPALATMSLTDKPLRVLLIDDGSPQLAMIHDELARQGHDVRGVVESPIELAAEVTRADPDVIIIAAESPSRDTLEHVAAMSAAAPRPTIVFTEDPDRALMQRAFRAGVSSYVVAGLAPERLRPVLDVAIARFEQDAALRAELENTRRKLSERKRIERAKGILMQARGLDEEAAYREMRKMAMDRGAGLAEIAHKIIEAKSLLS
jgi:two-component system, response regulator / RNA-binding antiterminator